MRRRAWLVGVAAAAMAPRTRADEVKPLLSAITQARAGLQTLVAPFTQERSIGLLATAVKSEGELTLVRPERLRWELKPPDAIIYWITPEGLAYETPSGGGSAGKSAAGHFGATLLDVMTLLGGELTKLQARYALSVQRSSTRVVLTAEPTAEEIKRQVKRLTLEMAPDLWTLQRIEIEENGGDRSMITFGRVVRDVKVDPARMKPPKR